MKHKYPQFEGMSDMDVIFMIREVKALDFPEDDQWLKEAEEGTAFFRISKELGDFITLCEEKHQIIGFEYTLGELNFGVIIKEKSTP